MSTTSQLAPPVEVTADIDRFIGTLLPADVLLFDKMNVWNGLVQWGDRAPVGHAALYLGRGEIVEASQGEPAVRKTDLKALFATWDVRTVTALRFARVAEDARATEAVLAVGERYAEEHVKSSFAMTHLVALAPHALYRAYVTETVKEPLADKPDVPKPPPPLQGMERVLASRWVQALLRISRRGGNRSSQTDLQFTCSELVYRCFAEADLPSGKEGELTLDVVPLTVLSARRGGRRRSSRPVTASSAGVGLPAPGALVLDDVEVAVEDEVDVEEPLSPAEEFWTSEQFADMHYGAPPTPGASADAEAFEGEAERGLREALEEYGQVARAAAPTGGSPAGGAQAEGTTTDGGTTPSAEPSGDSARGAGSADRTSGVVAAAWSPRQLMKKVLPPLPGGVHADDVTPGDLWRSLSLDPVIVLHKTPERPARPTAEVGSRLLDVHQPEG
jgi:hypothetical protein